MSLTPRLDRLDQNLLINGNFAFNQRGNNTSVSGNTYVLDRWNILRENAGGTILEVTQEDGDVPASSNSRYSMKVNVGTASGAAAISSRRVKFAQYVEGHMMPKVIGKRAKLRFWVKSNLAQTFAFGIRSNGSGVNYFLTEYTINSTDTWELKEIVLPEFLSSIDWQTNTNNRAAMFEWALDVGADFHGATNTSFQLGSAQAPNGYNTQFCDTLNNYIQISDVVVMPYESNAQAPSINEFVYAGRDYAEELQLCQRYYEKSYALSTEPGTATSTGRVGMDTGNVTTNAMNRSFGFQVNKVSTPTVVTYSWITGASGQVAKGGTDVAAVVFDATEHGFNAGVGTSSSADSIFFQWTAEAEL